MELRLSAAARPMGWCSGSPRTRRIFDKPRSDPPTDLFHSTDSSRTRGTLSIFYFGPGHFKFHRNGLREQLETALFSRRASRRSHAGVNSASKGLSLVNRVTPRMLKPMIF